jgi:hypothetical protein
MEFGFGSTIVAVVVVVVQVVQVVVFNPNNSLGLITVSKECCVSL